MCYSATFQRWIYSLAPSLKSRPIKIVYVVISCALSLSLLGKLSKMEMAFQSTKVGISWLLTFICWCPDFTLDVHQCPEGRLFIPSESKKRFSKFFYQYQTSSFVRLSVKDRKGTIKSHKSYKQFINSVFYGLIFGQNL